MTYFDNTYVLKLDIKEQQPNPVVRIVQFDSVYLNIELYDAGKKMDLKTGERFTVSVEHEETGKKNTGIARYDGSQFVVYELRKADMDEVGTYKARFASYENRNRVSSLQFRYEVYEDLEVVGDPNELTMLQELFNEVEEVGRVTQRQGEYAEDRGDYANAAGDYANTAGDSQIMNWLPYVKTLAERSSLYPNPNNGDTVYVISENKVFRYDGIDALDWEAISGYDTSVIQDLYNTKEDKVVVDALRDELRAVTIGGRNLLSGTELNEALPFRTATDKYTTTTNTTAKTLTVAPSGSYTSGSTYTYQLEKDIEKDSYVNLSFMARPQANDGTIKFKIGNGTYSTALPLGNTSSTYNTYTLSVRADHTSGGNIIYIEQTKGLIFRNDSIKVEQGNRPTAWSPSYEDLYKRIKTVRDIVDSNVSRINALEVEMNTNVVKKSVYAADKTKNEERFSQIIQDANGLTSIVGKKVDGQTVKSMINQSAEKIKIKASSIDFDGAVVFKNKGNKIDPNSYISINGGKLISKGYYERTFRDGKKRNRVQVTTLDQGMVRVTDPQGNKIDNYGEGMRSLYYTSDGISTFKDGSGRAYNPKAKIISSGTIEFFSHAYSSRRGITMYAAGALGLQSYNNAVHVDAAGTLYNRSRKSDIRFRPHESLRNGKNEFQMGVSTNNTGRFVYGDTSKNLGVGFRMSKSSKDKTIWGIEASGSASSKVTLNIGAIKSDTITSRNGKKEVYWNGSGGGTLSAKSSLTAGGIKSNASNFYIGVSGELRVTNKKGYNNGKTVGYLPVKASKFNSVSSRKYKSNIEDLQIDTLDILKKTEIKQYNLNSDLDAGIKKTKYGVILEDTPEVLHEDDAIDIYGMVSILWDVVKKQQAQIEELTK
ncbi:tail fiber domain-containing protein [Mammaliicoccus sciuri]|uniref:tail fiber domain-containing protein n=1 Tax=Mammaliicoccus sciuri TaxID=1296 RepID=UPI001C630BB8|nr:tail fiber domain-containing protein [Mammaliicoccus sciuri]QYG29981.1 tail fiber domain-containing protein [Mammaliicoccus sciuri]